MNKSESSTNCLLCGSSTVPYLTDRNRSYLHCTSCDFIFTPSEHHLSPEKEKERYDLHDNTPNDSRYRNFLNRLFDPITEKVPPGAHGLDFGSGPFPVLALMFQESGYDCSIYDFYYADDPSVFNMKYDFIVCSETIEHMYRPREEFERFLTLVKPGGWIGIMTQLHDRTPMPFENWYYKDDPTHVCFFSTISFKTMSQTYGLHLEFASNNVMLFQR